MSAPQTRSAKNQRRSPAPEPAITTMVSAYPIAQSTMSVRAARRRASASPRLLSRRRRVMGEWRPVGTCGGRGHVFLDAPPNTYDRMRVGKKAMSGYRWSAGMLVAAALSLLPTGPFVLDRAASHLEFFVKDNRGGFTGVAPDLQAQAVVREQDGTFAADVIVGVDARSIATGSGLRDNQMRREFLQTDRYPEITFRGSVTPVQPVTQPSLPANGSGPLNLTEATREMAFPVRVTALLDSYLIEGTTTIRMTDFTIPIPRFLIFVAEDVVQVNLRVRFVSGEK